MGLVSIEMTEWQRPPIPKIFQLNRRAAALVRNHCQLATITAQGRFLLLFRQERSRRTLRSAAAPGRHQTDRKQQQRGEADQSSKRELLSRGPLCRGRELRGVGRLPAAEPTDEPSSLGPWSGLAFCLGLKAASSAAGFTGAPRGVSRGSRSRLLARLPGLLPRF